MKRPRRLGASPALLVFAAAVSCASGGVPRKPEAVPPATAEAALPGGAPAALPAAVPAAAAPPPAPAATETALKIAEPAELSKARDERGAIESAIVFGSPSSLERAQALVAASTLLKPEEARAYLDIAEGVSALAYPAPGAAAAPVGPPPAGLPAAPASPQADPAPKPGAALAAALGLLAEARAGRVLAVPPEAAGTPLGELLPALALFASDSRDVARRAAAALDRFARLGTPSALPDLVLGIDLERQKDYEAALSRYAAALALAPDAWRAGLGSGRVLLALARPEEALAFLEPLAPSLAGSLSFERPYAWALVENGRYDEAEPLVARVLTADPQDSPFILIRARLLVRSRSFQQALPLLDAYGTVDPSNRLFLLLRCRASEGLKSRDEALRWARRGLSSFPDDPELLAAAARLLYSGPSAGREEARLLAARSAAMLGKAASASESPAARAERVAASAEAARLLAGDAASRYDWKGAASYLSAAMAAAPFEDRPLAATILRKARAFPEALAYAADWYRAEPDSEAAAEAYIRAFADSGDAKSAQELIARLLPGNHSGQFRSSLYFLQSALQKSDDAALSLLRSALMENGDNPEALAALSDIQARRKDYAKARFYLKQALALSPGDPDLVRRQAELDKAGQ